MQTGLSGLVAKLQQVLGSNLKSVVLYGSAVTGEFNQQHSDLNVLCVLDKLGATELARLNPAAQWWSRQGHPAPLVFSLAELRQAADVFAIELVDIKSGNRILAGEDVFAGLEVPMNLHRLQVERELRTNLIKLRQQYLVSRQDNKAILKLMTDSVSSFASLFRHALLALGAKPEAPSAATHDPAPAAPGAVAASSSAETKPRKRDAVDQLAALLGFNAGGFHIVLDVRQGRRRAADVDVATTFHAYLDAVTRVAEEVDKRLASI